MDVDTRFDRAYLESLCRGNRHLAEEDRNSILTLFKFQEGDDFYHGLLSGLVAATGLLMNKQAGRKDIIAAMSGLAAVVSDELLRRG